MDLLSDSIPTQTEKLELSQRLTQDSSSSLDATRISTPLTVDVQTLIARIMHASINNYCMKRELQDATATSNNTDRSTLDTDSHPSNPSIVSLHMWKSSLLSDIDLYMKPSITKPPMHDEQDISILFAQLLPCTIAYMDSLKNLESSLVKSSELSAPNDASTTTDDPVQLIPTLIAQFMLATFVPNTDPTLKSLSDKQLCYDARLRAILRQLSYRMIESLALTPIKSTEISKLAALYMSDAERQVSLILCAKTFHPSNQQTDETSDAAMRNASAKRIAKFKKWAGIGAATVAGGILVGVTGGLAAPLIGAGLGTIFTGVGLAGASATVAGMGTIAGAAIVGSLFGVTGGGLAAYKLNNRLKDIQEFYFTQISDEDFSGAVPLSYVIAIAGWINTPEDAIEPWHDLTIISPFSPINALTFETHHLISLTNSAKNFLAQTAVVTTATQAMQFTILGGLVGAVVWPVGLLQCAWVVDNPWSMALVKSEQAGRLLAQDILGSYMAGKRSVNLVGFGVGARVIIYCLLELVEMAKHSDTITGKGDLFGIVDSVYIAGTAVAMPVASWESIRCMVAGRFVNAYSSNDWFLGFLNRMSINAVAGIGPISSDMFENVDVSDIIDAHKTYNTAMYRVLEKMKFEQHVSA
ncbi:hypothetical protein BATDEDRAFT_87293 [Batrachochytrium dendrobatidis JAM81]|uniref:DUF726 domain-containing protein n=2 Tax=Batrachochytrium dendrobatidis TaxID=109871 RepID=F4NXQ7_BATDJ|nr:uncharacterized protein BATDEDRAFT_87293 [Batrachochytrium dendrobatidis JAM81]EGF81889.1 hypothetical protein BATDEDRAFT_87293 [Batrachochytrium dendrobatidis JAM81]|eukprot:XP_006677565.1 hypothetical protein BATDEDRAFT_87293 [Batrachochytrium dendrobatidis JAM81]